MKEVNASYPTLFQKDDQDEVEDGKEQTEENSDSEESSEVGTDAFTSK